MNANRNEPKTIDEYIAGFSSEKREILERMRTTITEVAPGAKEAIKYQIPTFVMNENLVHFAAFQRHIGFYPTPSGIERFKDELSVYEGAKGSVRFPIDREIPWQLIKKIVAFRVEEVRGKAAAKKKSR
jgi:uncharacterized protein YdhG (YjbR/CyaY superfamily)